MSHRIAMTGMWVAILIPACFLPFASAAEFEPISGNRVEQSDLWSASGGSTSFQFDANLLGELRISISGPARKATSGMPGEVEFTIQRGEGLELWAPLSVYDGFAAGEMRHAGRLAIEWPGGSLESDGFTLRPDSAQSLELIDDQGNPLFRLTYIHTMLDRDEQGLTLWNMDVGLTPWLAGRMGYPDLAGFVIGAGFSRTRLAVPAEAPEGAACGPANWHDGQTFVTDVALINMSGIQEVERQAGVRVAIAPNATLKNVGTADVPWFEKFTTVPPDDFGDYPEPYSRDQHPFLVWAMYRIVDDIPQQIGQSAVKHAFFSTNVNCGCNGGNILWSANTAPGPTGCEDTYSVSNNDAPQHLGVRDELPASTGAWEQCGSMFAPGATPPGPCQQTAFGSDAADPGFERRLVVQESELQTANASYLFEGWYVIRDDINIFNTMAHRTVTPTLGSTWTFSPYGVHTEGPAINSWVPPNTRGANQAHSVYQTENGHYSLAVKVSDAGGGMYRYVYALMNYDFDPKFESFSLPIPSDAALNNIAFYDGDNDGGNNWALSFPTGQIRWTAPAGAELEWGYMATFVLESDKSPSETLATLSGSEIPAELHADTLGLTPGTRFYFDGFEPNAD